MAVLVTLIQLLAVVREYCTPVYSIETGEPEVGK